MTATPTRRTWRAYPQEDGLRECLRYALATAAQIDPDHLPVSGTFLGDEHERYNVQLRALNRLQLVKEPADWRPEDERETWIACVRTRHEWQHAIACAGSRLLYDPDEWFKRLPVDKIDHCLRIEHLNLSDLSAGEILELAVTLAVMNRYESREPSARARALMDHDGLKASDAFMLGYLDVDLAEIRALLRKGSTPGQALRILA